jgi:copper oxidase (laccase) domain-containing protein
MNPRVLRHAGLLGFELPGLEGCAGLRHVFAARDPATGAGNLSLSGKRDRTAALAARAAWSAHLGVQPQDWTCGALVHGAAIRVVGEADRGRGAQDSAHVLTACDGLITETPKLPLYLPVADCGAVLIHRGGARPRLGLFHAGWRGLAAGILREAVRRMREGADEGATWTAAISPCARAALYAVGPEVLALAPATAVQRRGGGGFVDIGAWCVAELCAAGLATAAVHDCGLDTLADARCFSHRREGPTGGRNGLVARLNDHRP